METRLTITEIKALRKMLNCGSSDTGGYMLNVGKQLLDHAEKSLKIESELERIDTDPDNLLQYIQRLYGQ